MIYMDLGSFRFPQSVPGHVGVSAHSTEFSSGSLYYDPIFFRVPSVKWPSVSFTICWVTAGQNLALRDQKTSSMYKYDGTTHQVVTRCLSYPAKNRVSFYKMLCPSNVFAAKKNYSDTVLLGLSEKPNHPIYPLNMICPIQDGPFYGIPHWPNIDRLLRSLAASGLA